MALLRYQTDEVVTSTQNGFSDLLDWLGFLCAKDYLHDVLVKVHGLTAQEAKRRAVQIVPHVRIARGYIEQSLEGPKELAFLPAYYAILNLSKVYVLLGLRHADLPKHRLHGASYNPTSKDSHSVLTEVFSVQPKGVFALFYETLTNRAAKSKTFTMQVKDVLPYISGIGHEYSLATGHSSRLWQLMFGTVDLGPGHGLCLTATILTPPPASGGTLTIPCLSRLRPVPAGQPCHFIGDPITNPANLVPDTRTQIETHLILRMRSGTFTLLDQHKIEFPEEVPIWLLFFYMSSIVRYKPEFVSRLRDSKYWPPLSAAALHSFLDFLLAFWSFVHRKNYFIVAP